MPGWEPGPGTWSDWLVCRRWCRAGSALGLIKQVGDVPDSIDDGGDQPAAVLWRFLALHEECISHHCAVPGFAIVTTAPSTSGRTGHPLRAMAAEMVQATRDRYRDLLTPTPEAARLGRTASPTRCTAAALRGESVLLIDDTWATGNHAQSAAAALKAAGAGGVAVVVLGRHLNLEYATTADHVEQARLRRFAWDVCPLRPWSHP